MQDVEVRAGVVSLTSARKKQAEQKADRGPGSVSDAWDFYRQLGLMDEKPKSTRDSYRTAVERCIREVQRPTLATVQQWAKALVDSGLAPATANWYVRSVRAVVVAADIAAEESTRFSVIRKAFDGYRRLQEPERTARVPGRDIVVRLMRSSILRNHAEKAFVMLLATCGLRIDEALGLELQDYDDRTRVVHITKQRANKQCRKNKKPHSVRVGETVAGFLRATQIHHQDFYPSRGRCTQNKRYLFPWGRTYVESFMARIRTVCPDLTRGTAWHGFRHLAATEVLRRGGTISQVQNLLGDKSRGAASMYDGLVRGVEQADCALNEGALLDERLLQVEMRSACPDAAWSAVAEHALDNNRVLLSATPDVKNLNPNRSLS